MSTPSGPSHPSGGYFRSKPERPQGPCDNCKDKHLECTGAEAICRNCRIKSRQCNYDGRPGMKTRQYFFREAKMLAPRPQGMPHRLTRKPTPSKAPDFVETRQDYLAVQRIVMTGLVRSPCLNTFASPLPTDTRIGRCGIAATEERTDGPRDCRESSPKI
jgi:hypothetical protein